MITRRPRAEAGLEARLVPRWGHPEEEARPSPAPLAHTAPRIPRVPSRARVCERSAGRPVLPSPRELPQPHGGGTKPPLPAAPPLHALGGFPAPGLPPALRSAAFYLVSELSPRCVGAGAPDGSFFFSGCLGGQRGGCCLWPGVLPAPATRASSQVLTVMLGLQGTGPWPPPVSTLSLVAAVTVGDRQGNRGRPGPHGPAGSGLSLERGAIL